MLLKESDFVISIEKEYKRTNYIYNNLKLYNMEKKVEILCSDFNKNYLDIKADLVFLNPDYIETSYN